MPATSPAVAAARLRAQLLSHPVAEPEQVVERLLAVQAQDGRAFRLAVRSRTHGCTARDVDAALTERRSLVVSWLCRGTLHLVRAEDYPWLHALTAPRIVPGNARRLMQLGVDPAATDRGVAVVVEALADGPRTRDELRGALDAEGVPTAGQALVHLLVAASLREHVVRGPVRDGDHCFVDARRWLGAVDPPDREAPGGAGEALPRRARPGGCGRPCGVRRDHAHRGAPRIRADPARDQAVRGRVARAGG